MVSLLIEKQTNAWLKYSLATECNFFSSQSCGLLFALAFAFAPGLHTDALLFALAFGVTFVFGCLTFASSVARFFAHVFAALALGLALGLVDAEG